MTASQYVEESQAIGDSKHLTIILRIACILHVLCWKFKVLDNHDDEFVVDRGDIPLVIEEYTLKRAERLVTRASAHKSTYLAVHI